MVTIRIILETRKQFVDGSHPVKMVVTYQRERKFYTVNLFANSSRGFSKDEWEKIQNPKNRKQLAEQRATLIAYQAEAIEVAKKIDPFSFEDFEAAFFQKKQPKTEIKDVFKTLDMIRQELFDEGRIKNSLAYRTAMHSLQSFAKTKKLPFSKVTTEWLKKYERFMVAEGKSKTTVGIYLRCLRHAFNREKIKDNYPFSKNEYQIPKGRNVKKALSIEDIKKIFQYEAEPGTIRDRMRDLWCFSYLCNGMNISDIARLQYKDVSDDAIVFVRKKTALKNPEPVVVALTPKIGRIIDKHGQRTGNYIFPILRPGMTPKEQQTAIDNTVGLINDHCARIAESIGIPRFTSYHARHSFAHIMKLNGASVEFIRESLGHTDSATTMNYLKNFEVDEKRRMAEYLTNFDV